MNLFTIDNQHTHDFLEAIKRMGEIDYVPLAYNPPTSVMPIAILTVDDDNGIVVKPDADVPWSNVVYRSDLVRFVNDCDYNSTVIVSLEEDNLYFGILGRGRHQVRSLKEQAWSTGQQQPKAKPTMRIARLLEQSAQNRRCVPDYVLGLSEVYIRTPRRVHVVKVADLIRELMEVRTAYESLLDSSGG